MLLIAALLIVILGTAHSYLGERYLLQRLFARAEMPSVLGSRAMAKGVLRYGWHLTTLIWFGLAGVLIAMQFDIDAPSSFLWMMTVLFGLCGIGALYGSRGKHLSWILFFVIAVLCAAELMA